MKYCLQLYYPGEALFVTTNHSSDDVDALRRLAASDLFRGARTRIIDDGGVVVCEPPVSSPVIDPTDPGPTIWTLRTNDNRLGGEE